MNSYSDCVRNSQDVTPHPMGQWLFILSCCFTMGCPCIERRDSEPPIYETSGDISFPPCFSHFNDV
jgi:hypothetical protein